MGEIKVGEYVRTEEGYIGKLVEYISNALNYLKIDVGREIRHCDNSVDNFIYTRYGFQIKHSPNIIDLIEEGDILEIEISKEWTDDENRIKIIAVGPTFTKQNIIRDIENGLYKIKAITTAEQFNQVKYEV